MAKSYRCIVIHINITYHLHINDHLPPKSDQCLHQLVEHYLILPLKYSLIPLDEIKLYDYNPCCRTVESHLREKKKPWVILCPIIKYVTSLTNTFILHHLIYKTNNNKK